VFEILTYHCSYSEVFISYLGWLPGGASYSSLGDTGYDLETIDPYHSYQSLHRNICINLNQLEASLEKTPFGGTSRPVLLKAASYKRRVVSLNWKSAPSPAARVEAREQERHHPRLRSVVSLGHIFDPWQ
jgi:hypothetical protein